MSVCADAGERLQHADIIVTHTYQMRSVLVDKNEISRVQTYFRSLFKLDTITVQARPNKDDSVEVSIDGEFIGVLFRDEDEGEVSYAFNMAILDIDLPEE